MAEFPRVERYLARLPYGFASYPDCLAKASVYRTFTESRSLKSFPWSKVRPEIATMLRTPVPHSAWISEVAVSSAILALTDHYGYDDEETVRWFHECNSALLTNRMYRAIMSLASPALMMKGAAHRWGNFHRGTGFGMAQEGNEAHITLRFPPFLFDAVVLRGLAEGIQIAVSMSRAKDAQVEIVSSNPQSAVYRLSWT